MFMWNEYVELRQWQSYGYLTYGVGYNGITTVGIYSNITVSLWEIATNSDEIYLFHNIIGERELLKYGFTGLNTNNFGAGINFIAVSDNMNSSGWNFATF